MMNWTPEQENMLKTLKEGPENITWSAISKKLRKLFEDKYHTAKQCRQRYINYVRFQRNDEKFLKWSKDEEELLYDLYEKIGSNWNIIGQSFDFKSQNTIKNKFYGSLRKLLRRLNSIGKSTRKLRKQLRYQSLIRPLQISKSLNKDTKLSEMALSLRKQLIQFLKTNFENLIEETALNFIQNINKFNLMSRSMSRKKSRRESDGDLTENRQNRFQKKQDSMKSSMEICKLEEEVDQSPEVKIQMSQFDENQDFGQQNPIKRENNIIVQGMWSVDSQGSFGIASNTVIPYHISFNYLQYQANILNPFNQNTYQNPHIFPYKHTEFSIQSSINSSFTRIKLQQ